MQNTNKWRRAIAALLVAVMVTTIVPVMAFTPLGEQVDASLSCENEPHLIIKQQLYVLTVDSFDGLRLIYGAIRDDLFPTASSNSYYVVSADNSFAVRAADRIHGTFSATTTSSNPSVLEILWDSGSTMRLVVRGEGSTTITLNTTPTGGAIVANMPATRSSMTITITSYERTNVKAWPERVQIIGDMPIFLTQEDITALLEFAPLRSVSNITLPNRRLTDEERDEWIADYLENGGATRVELEIMFFVNQVRAEYDLPPVSICNRQMMAARFYSQTMHTFNRLGHNVGPYATNPNATHGASANVAEAFGARPQWNGGNGHRGFTSGQAIVNSWMNSPGHRRYILSSHHQGGAGHFGGFSYLFFNSQGTPAPRLLPW